MEKRMALGICLLGFIPKRFMAPGNNQQDPISCLRMFVALCSEWITLKTKNSPRDKYGIPKLWYPKTALMPAFREPRTGNYDHAFVCKFRNKDLQEDCIKNEEVEAFA